MGNENSTTSKPRGKPARAPSIEPQYAPRKLGTLPTKSIRMVDLGVYPVEQHGKQSSLVNDDDAFTNYILRAKLKLRSVSDINGHQREEISHPAPNVANAPVATNNTKDDDHNDHFSDFIQRTRKKLRTVSRVGKNNGSFKRG